MAIVTSALVIAQFELEALLPPILPHHDLAVIRVGSQVLGPRSFIIPSASLRGLTRTVNLMHLYC